MADPIEQNIHGVQQLVGSKLNKVLQGAGGVEGVEGAYEDQFTLKLDDEELLALANQWELDYRGYEAKIRIRQNANKTYYLGTQKEGTPFATTDGQPIASNVLWEASETFYPASLAKNPEPVVFTDDTPEGNELASTVKTMLQYHADTLEMRGKLNLMVRKWSVDFLGVIKHGWDEVIKDLDTDVRDVKDFIFDPKGYVDVHGDFVGYLGERITLTAEKLVELFPHKKAFITIQVIGKMGTDVVYTEWWNDDYTFCTFKGEVLDKSKNPHFNYDAEEEQAGLDGETEMVEKKGNNHFGRPKKPYTFLAQFTFGDQPHDVTGMIEQNIPNQRMISRRTEQIDFNLTRQNNSDIFSGDNFNQETAKQAATGMAKGHPILVPSGQPLGNAVLRLPAQGLDGSFFTDLDTTKNTLRSSFGTQGITATQQDEDQTARGMILNNQYDTSRIGGGVGDALERVAKSIFNWHVQMYCVYYDEPHVGAIMGQMKAVEYTTLSSEDLDRRVVVSVSPDSMKSHDEITEMNQAISLWQAGALDPKTLLTMVNIPDPQETAESTVLWLLDKQAYLQLNFPELAQQLAQAQQQAQQQMAQSGAPPQATGGGQQPAQAPPSTGVPPAGASLSSIPIK